jgi:hypothetical protein
MMTDLSTMETRDQEVRASGTPPTQAERDRRQLIGSVKLQRELIREALGYLKVGDDRAPLSAADVEAAVDALRYALEQA